MQGIFYQQGGGGTNIEQAMALNFFDAVMFDIKKARKISNNVTAFFRNRHGFFFFQDLWRKIFPAFFLLLVFFLKNKGVRVDSFVFSFSCPLP